MHQVVWFVIIVTLLAAWVAMEMRGRAGPRVVLGLAVMVCIGLTWLFAESRTAHLDAYHQALFRQIDAALEAGDIEKVKRVVSAYNHADAGSLRVFQAMDAMENKID